MRILHIDSGASMRGGQWQVLHLLQELTRRRIPTRLLAAPNSPLLQAAESLRLDVRPLSLGSLLSASGSFDLIHAHDARSHALALAVRKPLIVSRRVAFPLRRSLLSRWKYRRATHFVAVSEHVKQILTGCGIESRKISIVYDGVPLPECTSIQIRTGVLALDSADPGKGKSIVDQAAKLAGIEITFSHQLSQDLSSASLFVYITDSEGLGSAALLAMAHGTPVIASNVGGLPEIVEHGRTGLLTSNEPAKVAAAMRQLLDDRAYAARLAARARQQVERNFTVNHMTDDTVLVYERILHA